MNGQLNVVRLGDVCTIASSLVDPRSSPFADMIHVGGANIESESGRLVALKTAREEGLISGKFVFDDSTVLYSKIRPYLRKVARPTFPGLCSADVYPLLPDPDRLDRSFLYHLLLSAEFTDFAVGGSARAGMPKVNRDHLFTFQFKLPSLNDQQRIVAVLDEAFEGIAAARASAERNLRNARALLESENEVVFARAYDSGPVVPLADLATDITDGDHMPPPKSESGVPFVTIGNVDKRTRTLDFAGAFRVPESYYNGLKANRKPQLGDVLYTVTGSFGIPVLVRDRDPFCFQRHIGLVRPRADVDSAWLYYLLASPQVFRQADERATGTAQRTVSLQVLRSIRVPHSPLPVQQNLVARLDALNLQCERLGRIYKRKLAALDELKRSLLHHAFTGRLTSRAPAAHTQELV